jgi:hypothetical protein
MITFELGRDHILLMIRDYNHGHVIDMNGVD